MSHIFKLIYFQTASFHKKAKFCKIIKKFWVLQNSDPTIHSLNETNKKMPAKSIATFDFSTLYTKLSHDKLVDELSLVIGFAFDWDNTSYIRISTSRKAFQGKKRMGIDGFSKAVLQTIVTLLIENCYFNIGNITIK